MINKNQEMLTQIIQSSLKELNCNFPRFFTSAEIDAKFTLWVAEWSQRNSSISDFILKIEAGSNKNLSGRTKIQLVFLYQTQK